MATPLSWVDAVDIGLGRGRLASEAAASLARVDVAMRSAFGRAADINEAWRSPEQANANYARYIAFINGRGPWAPIALPATESIHCVGYAVDTDDTSDAQMRIWNDHGWYWTVYRNGKLAERWHLEYFRDRDNHRNAPAGTVIDERLIVNQDDKDYIDGMGASVVLQVAALLTNVPADVWKAPIQAQDENGILKTRGDGSPVTYPASGYIASTNARAGSTKIAMTDAQAQAVAAPIAQSLKTALTATITQLASSNNKVLLDAIDDVPDDVRRLLAAHLAR